MINLIPNEEKKKIAHHFYSRLTILSFLTLGLCAWFAILALVPSWILSKAKQNIIEQDLVIQKGEPVPILDQETSQAIEKLDAKLTLVEQLQTNKFVVTERIINELIKSKVANVKITRISYEVDEKNTRNISISGEATSREELLSFRKALESNQAFKDVTLPISSFVKGENIEFLLSLTPAI